jgi:hypothetical protein
VLALVPGRADTERRAAAGEHVERGDDLGQQAGVAIGHTGDERAELHRGGARGEEAQRRVRLQHRVLGAAVVLHLEVVVHYRKPGNARVLTRLGDRGQLRPDALRALWVVEPRYVNTQSHVDLLVPHRVGENASPWSTLQVKPSESSPESGPPAGRHRHNGGVLPVIIVLSTVVGLMVRPRVRGGWGHPGVWLPRVTAACSVNQVLFTIYVLRVHNGDVTFVSKFVPTGWFALADSRSAQCAGGSGPTAVSTRSRSA